MITDKERTTEGRKEVSGDKEGVPSKDSNDQKEGRGTDSKAGVVKKVVRYDQGKGKG